VKQFVRLSILAAVGYALLGGAAQAAIVTVGSIGTPTTSATAGGVITLLNTALPEPGATVTSPISGMVIRWHVTRFEGGPFKLRVLTPEGGGTYKGSGTSAPETPASTAEQTYSTHLPIEAGQTLAIDNTNPTDRYGLLLPAGSTFGFSLPPVADGFPAVLSPSGAGEYAYNAEVQPLPGIAAIGPTDGPATGGTSVLISGHDFTGATSVTFGGTPASSFTVVAETTITATAPPSSSAGSVPVSVITLAGSASSPSPFSYTTNVVKPASTCTVPNLKGRTLKSSKKRIRAVACLVGKLSKREGATASTGNVVKQVPKPGAVVPVGTKVKITLGPLR
jgi:hypothetical protein